MFLRTEETFSQVKYRSIKGRFIMKAKRKQHNIRTNKNISKTMAGWRGTTIYSYSTIVTSGWLAGKYCVLWRSIESVNVIVLKSGDTRGS